MTQFTGTYEQAVRDFVKDMPQGSARKQAAKAMLAEIDQLRARLAPPREFSITITSNPVGTVDAAAVVAALREAERRLVA